MKYKKGLLKIAGILVSLIITTTVTAQSKLDLKPGQKFETENKITTTSTMEMMGEQTIKGDVTVIRQLEIKNKKEKTYKVASTITKMTTAIDAPGQNISYDSDKKEDTASMFGQLMKDKINVPAELEMNDEGKIIPLKKEDNLSTGNASGMEAMLKNFSGGADETMLTDDMFITVPKKIKVGDTWSDSIIAEGSKTYRDYTVKSVQGKEAVVTITGKQLTDKKMENQGMEMTLTMDSKITGEMTVDTNTAVIKQRAITIEGSGDMGMMGQQIPMTTKVEMNSATKNL